VVIVWLNHSGGFEPQPREHPLAMFKVGRVLFAIKPVKRVIGEIAQRQMRGRHLQMMSKLRILCR